MRAAKVRNAGAITRHLPDRRSFAQSDDFIFERPLPEPGAQEPGLEFRIEKLKATGFEPTNLWDPEIDQTLRLCQSTYSPSL